MFGLFKADPAKRLAEQYRNKLTEAMEAQRAGDIRKYSELTEQAEKIQKEMADV